MLLCALFALLAASLLMMARLLLRPARMSDGKAAYLLKRLSPGDLGLHFQTLEFEVRDDHSQKPIKLAAWWIAHPAARGKCVVIIHGYGDAKVGAIAWAPMWHELGYHILAIDLRAHGESEGRETTAGYFERHDLNRILDQLCAARPADTRTLVLFGISLGGAVSLAAAETRENIVAIVLDSPFTQYSHAVRAHARRMNMPFPKLIPWSIRLAQSLSGARFDDVRPIDLLTRVRCPIMVIAGGCDPFLPAEDLSLLEATMARRTDGVSRFWKVPEGEHVLSISTDPEAYRERIEAFLKDVLALREVP
jgi:hypothetical protein